jgi:hypothetical protein
MFEVFDHVTHAAHHTPSPAICRRLMKLFNDRKLRPRERELREQLHGYLGEHLQQWLNTLPAGAMVSGVQICEVFCGPEAMHKPFRMAFLGLLYDMRRSGAVDGYWSTGGINQWGKPYVNFHRSN